MLKAIKEFFFGKSNTDSHPLDGATKRAQVEATAPYKIEPPQTSVQTDPVAVALDLEPMDLSGSAEPAKKPRKPRAPKAAKTTAAKKTTAKKTTKKAK